MTALGLRLQPLRPLLALPKPALAHHPRPFSLPSLSDLSNLSSPTAPKTITAHRTLPYPSPLLYSIIAAIPLYSTFLPFCTASTTHASTPTTPPLPALASLTVGWGPFPAESYTSRVYCVPGSTVEAVSGDSAPSTPWAVLRRYGYDEAADGRGGVRREGDGELFRSLRTKWTVEPVEGTGGETTDVHLRIDYLLANPLHQIAVGGVADQVADKMIRAFEARAAKLYGEWKRTEGKREGR